MTDRRADPKPWLAAFAIVAIVGMVGIQARTGVEIHWSIYGLVGCLGGIPAADLFNRKGS